jgi:hypothetical protein
MKINTSTLNVRQIPTNICDLETILIYFSLVYPKFNNGDSIKPF